MAEPQLHDPTLDLSTLDEIRRRVLWLAVRMVDYANRERPRLVGSARPTMAG